MPALHLVIAAGIRRERAGAGLSQDDVAAVLGVDRAVISRMEAGTRHLTLSDELMRLCEALGCTVAQLADRASDTQRQALGLPPRPETELA